MIVRNLNNFYWSAKYLNEAKNQLWKYWKLLLNQVFLNLYSTPVGNTYVSPVSTHQTNIASNQVIGGRTTITNTPSVAVNNGITYGNGAHTTVGATNVNFGKNNYTTSNNYGYNAGSGINIQPTTSYTTQHVQPRTNTTQHIQ